LETLAGTYVSANAGFVIFSLRRFCVENLSGEHLPQAATIENYQTH